MCITFSSNMNRGNRHGIILIMNVESEWNNTVNKIQIILAISFTKTNGRLGRRGCGDGEGYAWGSRHICAVFSIITRTPDNLARVASFSLRFRSKERGTRVKDRAKNGSRLISRAMKTGNPLPRSFFAPKPNGNACYAGYR